MTEEAILEFRLGKINETRNYLLEEIKLNDLTREKYKKTCKYLNYVKHLLIIVSIVIGFVSISVFAFVSLCSCWSYKFCRRNKNLCNHYSN